jgi:hypothetical protein
MLWGAGVSGHGGSDVPTAEAAHNGLWFDQLGRNDGDN